MSTPSLPRMNHRAPFEGARVSQCWRRMMVALLALMLAGCATRVAVPSVPLLAAPQAQAAWARVLDRFVNEVGEVDFAALSQDRSDLDHYVRFVAQEPLVGLDYVGRTPDDLAHERLAHLINAYNALSMFNVIDSGIPITHAGFNKVGFFILRTLQIGGEERSLYNFENEVIRPYTRRLGEPRVHFALNCSALACPRLPRTPFTGADLPQQLERESRAFFARPDNFRVDHSGRTVWLSEILDFYPEDFVPTHGVNLIDYANRFVAEPAPLDYRIRYTPYDWTVANRRFVTTAP